MLGVEYYSLYFHLPKSSLESLPCLSDPSSLGADKSENLDRTSEGRRNPQAIVSWTLP